MASWMNIAEQQLPEFRKPVEDTSLPDEIRKFWGHLSERRAAKGISAALASTEQVRKWLLKSMLQRMLKRIPKWGIKRKVKRTLKYILRWMLQQMFREIESILYTESCFLLLSFSDLDLIEGSYNIKLRKLFWFPNILKSLVN